MKMSAKELKAIADIGIALGYSGDELKQFVNDEKMTIDREREKEIKKQREMEENEKQRKFELEKLKIKSETKQKEMEAKQKEMELNAQTEKEKADALTKQIEMEIEKEQEGQHPLTGQRAPPISGGTQRRRRTLIDGYLESPFPTACLL